MDYEKAYKKFKTHLERLGVSIVDKDDDVQIDEQTIVSAILANKSYTKSLIDEANKAHESLLIGKMRKSIEGLGVEVGEEQDIKKLVELGKTHLLKSAGDGKDEIVKKNSELQNQLQEYKILVENKEKEFATNYEKLTKEKESEIGKIRRNTDVATILSSKNLTDSAKKNVSTIVDNLISPKLDKLDIREENGKKVVYTTDGNKRFKSDIFGGEPSTEAATLEDVIDFEISQLGFVKQTDATGGGSPDATPPVPTQQGQNIVDPTNGFI